MDQDFPTLSEIMNKMLVAFDGTEDVWFTINDNFDGNIWYDGENWRLTINHVSKGVIDGTTGISIF